MINETVLYCTSNNTDYLMPQFSFGILHRILQICTIAQFDKCFFFSILKIPRTKIFEFGTSVDSDEAAHDELPHLDLHCLPTCDFSIFYNLNLFSNFADANFVSFKN